MGGGMGGLGPWQAIAQMMQKGTGDTAIALGTGASIAGAALEKPPKERTAVQLPTSNPLTQAATFELLTRLGVPIDTSVLLQASPIQQALNRRGAVPMTRETRRRLLRVQEVTTRELEQARAAGDTRTPNQILKERFGNQEHAAMARLAADGGFASINEMFNAELNFRAQLPELQRQANQASADFSRLSQLSTQEQTAALEQLGRVSDVNALREQERARLLRDVELRRPELLAAANRGGFNPAGALEQLERTRQDADLEALSRALASATGQTQVANLRGATAQGLDPRLIALGLAPANTAAQGSIIGQSSSERRNGLSDALSLGGNALSNWGLLEVMQANNGGPLSAGGGLSGLGDLFKPNGPAAGPNIASKSGSFTPFDSGWTGWTGV